MGAFTLLSGELFLLLLLSRFFDFFDLESFSTSFSDASVSLLGDGPLWLLECPAPLLSRPLLLDLSSSVPTPPPGVTERSGLPSAKGGTDPDWRISIRSESSHTACLNIAAARRASPASAWNPPIKDPHLRHARHAWQLQDSLSSTGERPPITQSPSCGCKKSMLTFHLYQRGRLPIDR